MAKKQYYCVALHVNLPTGETEAWASARFRQSKDAGGTYSSELISVDYLLSDEKQDGYRNQMLENMSREFSLTISRKG